MSHPSPDSFTVRCGNHCSILCLCRCACSGSFMDTESYTMWSSGSFHFFQCFWGLSLLYCESILHSFLVTNSISSYRYAMFYLLFHQLADTGLFPGCAHCFSVPFCEQGEGPASGSFPARKPQACSWSSGRVLV